MKKLRVGVLFGGRSGEHEVSLLSAASVLNAIDKKKYDLVPIGITKEGRWLTPSHAERLLKGEKPATIESRHLRAGDPEATSAAAVLARGEGVVVPPIPGSNHSSLVPFETSASEMQAAAKPIDVDETSQLAASREAAPDVVEPEALPVLDEFVQGIRHQISFARRAPFTAAISLFRRRARA